ncbi:unnamed protein product [Symbiodinium pilosum]|uniref:Uncharacterized protein n=1 Tax=Symbiodinium pilosum TaxID=2952 RepID=A0A812YJ53_SYMPI|nr:unnamed protein product [Symbiodinium pilosum]
MITFEGRVGVFFLTGCHTTEDTSQGNGTLPEPSFNCQEDIDTWQRDFSEEKKAYCCSHHQVACSSKMQGSEVDTAEAPASHNVTFSESDCREDPVEHWSEAKKDWCCKNTQLGCAKSGEVLEAQDAKTTSEPFDCQVDPFEHWSEAKKQWCCSNKSLGCAKEDAPAKDAKKQWCCSNKSLGCAKEDAPAKDAKKQWCCSNKSLGCAKEDAPAKDALDASEPFDCQVDPVEHWSEAKKQWCCSNKSLGCAAAQEPTEDEPTDEPTEDEPTDEPAEDEPTEEPTEEEAAQEEQVAEPFNCLTRETWSDVKRRWCCSKKQLGCKTEGAPLEHSEQEPESFDCEDGSVEEWPEIKSLWCCSNKRVGCQKDLFNCHVDPVEDWSDMKKEWCCEEKRIGCPSFDASALQYDCKTDLAEWKQKWTEMHALFCCVFKGVACADEQDETPLQKMKEAQQQEELAEDLPGGLKHRGFSP